MPPDNSSDNSIEHCDRLMSDNSQMSCTKTLYVDTDSNDIYLTLLRGPLLIANIDGQSLQCELIRKENFAHDGPHP